MKPEESVSKVQVLMGSTGNNQGCGKGKKREEGAAGPQN